MRIILADDQPEIRSSLRLLLEQETDLQVVGEAADYAALLAETKKTEPDLILLDWELPGGRANDLVPLLLSLHPGLRIVALSGRPEVYREAVAAGADAFVSKGDHPEKVLAALRKLA